MFTAVHPEYVPYLLVPVTGITALALWYVRRRRAALLAYPTVRAAAYSTGAEVVRWSLLGLSLLASVVMVIGVRAEYHKPVPIIEGLEIAAMVDCSQSMLAPVGGGDFTSRLMVVTTALDDVFHSLPNDRFGLGCFSATLNGVTPTTNDYARILRPKLDVIEDPGYIEMVGKGTNFGAAIDGCRKSFNVNKKTKKVCIILSDGEPEGQDGKLQKDLDEAVMKMRYATAEKKLDVAFYLVGVGSPDEEMKIPSYDAYGNPKGFAADKEGNIYLTRPDPEYLRRIADQFDGKQIHLKSGERLSVLLEDIMNAERHKVGERDELVRLDVSTPIGMLLFILLFFFMKWPKRLSLRRKDVEVKK